MKNKELGEAAKTYAIDNSLLGYENPPFKGFIAGAKWQAERSYSEEEVWNILLKAWEATGNLKSTEYRLIEPFEQFKKK